MGRTAASKGACPECGKTVEVARLSYRVNAQRTECPNGHDVHRMWSGPEDPSWRPNDPERPYGWSRWALYPELPLEPVATVQD